MFPEENSFVHVESNGTCHSVVMTTMANILVASGLVTWGYLQRPEIAFMHVRMTVFVLVCVFT